MIISLFMVFIRIFQKKEIRKWGIAFLISSAFMVMYVTSSIITDVKTESYKRQVTIEQIATRNKQKVSSRSSNPFVYYDHNGKRYTKAYKCPKCNTVNENGNTDCEKCGYKLTDSMVYCKNCGASFKDTMTYCPHCKSKDLEHY